MGVSCGYSPLTKLRICASHGVNKALHQVWCLPKTSHSYFLPILSSPLFDEICRRSINFIRFCLSNESSLFRLSMLFSMVELCRVLVRMFYFVCVVIFIYLLLNRARSTNKTSLILWCNAVHHQTNKTYR